jgi:hypothetical protein
MSRGEIKTVAWRPAQQQHERLGDGRLGPLLAAADQSAGPGRQRATATDDSSGPKDQDRLRQRPAPGGKPMSGRTEAVSTSNDIGRVLGDPPCVGAVDCRGTTSPSQLGRRVGHRLLRQWCEHKPGLIAP